MKCPACDAKISNKHFDADYDWYECPKCEGCFTSDELDATPKVQAKGKKRHAVLDAEAEALAKYEEQQMVVQAGKDTSTTHHRDEIRTKEVVNIMADEIQTIYRDFGFEIDEINAQDKALIIWREAKIHSRGSAREKEVDFVTCKEHS